MPEQLQSLHSPQRLLAFLNECIFIHDTHQCICIKEELIKLILSNQWAVTFNTPQDEKKKGEKITIGHRAIA